MRTHSFAIYLLVVSCLPIRELGRKKRNEEKKERKKKNERKNGIKEGRKNEKKRGLRDNYFTLNFLKHL